MRTIVALVALAIAAASPVRADTAKSCDAGQGLSVSRVVEIDPTGGPLYGEISKYAREERFLAPKEVILTFDDGPMPWITKSILDTLDRYCTKATWFSVGRMALAYPNSVKDIMARGHTMGTHTWSHPLNLPRLSLDKATDQIERGFAAVAMAAGQPIAPFFRFPGLSDSDPLLAHLQSRGVATFTVDVVSNDSYIGDANRLAQYTIRQIEQRHGGIVLFHDIKSATAKALPTILAALKEKGYKVVHMRSKTTFAPKPELVAELKPQFEKVQAELKSKTLVPFYGAVIPGYADLPVTELAPAPRSRAKGPSTASDAPRIHRENATARSGGEAPAAPPHRRRRESPATSPPQSGMESLFPPFFE
jgi:peptidoglycan/xylan/chitin deacetylase (PgdA/CDA1 family)